MAKRGILTHPKTLLLADLLNIQEPFAVGILECLWQWVSDHYPSGDLSGVRGTLIARGIRYAGDAAQLVEALVEARLLDRSGDRVVVHDWSEHANDAVHLRLARAGDTFADGTEPSTKRMSKGERALLVRTRSAREAPAVRTPSAPPSPPLPSPPLPNGNGSADPVDPPVKGKRKETPEETEARKATVEAWLSRFPGATPPAARIWKALKPLVAKHGPAPVLENWRRYLSEQEPDFASPQSFAAKYPWTGKRGNGKASAVEMEPGPFGPRPKMPETEAKDPLPPKPARPAPDPAAKASWDQVVSSVVCSPNQRDWLSGVVPIGLTDEKAVRLWASNPAVVEYLRGTLREPLKAACESAGVAIVFAGGKA